MDLREILKIGDRLYSPICGKCELIQITDDLLKVKYSENKICLFKLDGHYYNSVECLLFPSKECRTWDDLNELIIRSPEKGRYVISADGRIFICDGTEYIIDNQRYYGSICYKWNNLEGILIPKSYRYRYIIAHRYANEIEIEEFNRELLSNGFSFDNESCTLIKIRPRVADGQIYYYIDNTLEIERTKDLRMLVDSKRYEIGNYFISSSKAYEALEKLKKLLNEKFI